MGFIADNLISHLRHSSKASFLPEETLRYCIWYSSTKESYPQRTTVFDGSWLEGNSSNPYVFLAIKKQLALASFIGFDNMQTGNNEIDSLKPTSGNKLYMYYNKAKMTSLFSVIVGSIRNGIAHGTFNFENDRFFLISQHHPNPESPVKFYLQLGDDFNRLLQRMFALFEEMASNPLEEKYRILSEPLNLRKDGERYYSERLNQFVLIDDQFSFASDSHVAEIQNRLHPPQIEDNTVVLVNEKISAFADRNLKNEDNNTRMTTVDKLLGDYQTNVFG